MDHSEDCNDGDSSDSEDGNDGDSSYSDEDGNNVICGDFDGSNVMVMILMMATIGDDGSS